MQVIFQDNPAITPGNETVAYDPVGNTLTFQISPQTTANDIITTLQNDPVAGAAIHRRRSILPAIQATMATASFPRKRSR